MKNTLYRTKIVIDKENEVLNHTDYFPIISSNSSLIEYLEGSTKRRIQPEDVGNLVELEDPMYKFTFIVFSLEYNPDVLNYYLLDSMDIALSSSIYIVSEQMELQKSLSKELYTLKRFHEKRVEALDWWENLSDADKLKISKDIEFTLTGSTIQKLYEKTL